jgi:hypothetical protein
MAHTNGIESVWAVLKRGYNGTFHNISTKHLNRYVDELLPIPLNNDTILSLVSIWQLPSFNLNTNSST